MPYFTSWDANLYLCLMSLGLPHDLSLSMTREIKKVHRDYCLEGARSYYLDRKKWLPQVGTKSCTLHIVSHTAYDIYQLNHMSCSTLCMYNCVYIYIHICMLDHIPSSIDCKRYTNHI